MNSDDRYTSLFQYYCSLELAKQAPSDLPSDLWRLVYEQVRAESSFNPNAGSAVGAVGLLQLMPETAIQIGVSDRRNPEQNLRGGISYLISYCWYPFKKEKGIDRLKFAIGAYNSGIGNIVKAQNLANARGLDSSLWDSIVKTLAEVTGEHARETIDYVARIFQGYDRGRE